MTTERATVDATMEDFERGEIDVDGVLADNGHIELLGKATNHDGEWRALARIGSGLGVVAINLTIPEGMDMSDPKEQVNHPDHYGGGDNPYEAIKVIEAWGLNFSLGSAVKYISRAGKKDPDKHVQDLEKAAWYVNREIERLKAEKENPQ